MSAKGKAGPTVQKIRELEERRAARRNRMAAQKDARDKQQEKNARNGVLGDVDFVNMIAKYREQHKRDEREHRTPGAAKVCICARKRPISKKEISEHDYDSVTLFNPRAVVHSCKLRVDGITKYLDNLDFEFDHTFDENSTTDEVYHYVVSPLVQYTLEGGRSMCFAYGQTGSGKTFTMTGVQQLAAEDIFETLDTLEDNIEVYVSFFEIYGGRCFDLLHKRKRISILENGKGKVVLQGLTEDRARDHEELLAHLERGADSRTTHATEMNSVSSRSHAVCEIVLRLDGRVHGKFSVVDLAGSERANDTRSHNRQRRIESAEINKSLLALKECIRGLDSGSSHIPFRASKLTMVLKDSFVSPNSRVAMVAAVSPAASSADHTQNTLRYADRVKEKGKGGGGGGPSSSPPASGAGHASHPSAGSAGGVARRGSFGGRAKPSGAAGRGPRVRSRSRSRGSNQAKPEWRGVLDDEESDDSSSRAPTPRRMRGRSGSSSNRGTPRGNGNDFRMSPVHAVQEQLQSEEMEAMMEDVNLRGGGRNRDRPGIRRSGSDRGVAGIGLSEDRRRVGNINMERGPGKAPMARGSRQHMAPDSCDSPSVDTRLSDDQSITSDENASDFKQQPLAADGPNVDLRNFEGRLQRAAPATASTPVAADEKPATILGRGMRRSSSQRDHKAVSPPGRTPDGPKRASSPRSPRRSPRKAIADPSSAGSPREKLRQGRQRRSSPSPIATRSEMQSPNMDLQMLHQTLRQRGTDHTPDGLANSSELLALHEAVNMIMDEEEALLNKHMSCIKRNAQLLTEESQLLAKVQGVDVVDYDIDGYVQRLDAILTEKLDMFTHLHRQLHIFRDHLAMEEKASKRVDPKRVIQY